MAITFALHHDTHYRYSAPVLLGPQTIRLRPATPNRTEEWSYDMGLGPNPATLRWLRDPLGNILGHAVVHGETRSLDIRVRLVTVLAPSNPFDFVLDAEVVEWPFRYSADMATALTPFLAPPEAGNALDGLAAAAARPGGTLDLLNRCNTLLHERIGYVARLAHGVQAPAATLRLGSGSCRDSAWLLVALLRRLGFAARFCSGYLVEPETAQHGDRADLHAWAEAWLPGAGWIGLDTTSGLFCAEGHILLAAGPDPAFCAPVTGTHTAAGADMSFSLRLERMAHDTPLRPADQRERAGAEAPPRAGWDDA